MTQAMDIRTAAAWHPTEWPLMRLLHPRQFARPTVVALAVGFVLSGLAVTLLNWPLWTATALVLAILLPVGVQKWRDDRRRYGTTIMWLSVLLTVQGVHTIEHLVQWGQYHLLYQTMRESNGLLSPANAEWVHFVWNWFVLAVVVVLMVGGMRNGWMWLLLVVAGFHAVEHSYTFIRYQLIFGELRALGVVDVTPQGLAGIVGRDGWLARSDLTRNTILCTIPGLTTAVRLDIHFWWNAAEIVLLMLGGHFYLRRLPLFSGASND